MNLIKGDCLVIEFLKNQFSEITADEMVAIYNKIKTPIKRNTVIKWDNDFTDSPTVFKKDGVFYMYFISISKDISVSGYETHLARSCDLINWDYIGPVFRRNNANHWDSNQCAGYAAFKDIRFDGSNELSKINDAFYISYLAGNSDGYEPDPLYMGLAKTCDPTVADSFIRFEQPILKPTDSDSREKETKTLYKSCLFEDILGVTGYPYVNCYNGKAQDDTERIFLAVSDDAEHWERYGDRHVLDMKELDPNTLITGDPQIICIDDIYVMLFFHYTKDKGAYNTFACSRDLVNWRVWDGKPLVEPTEPWENIHAHKTWFIRHGGVNYHYYCAVNSNNERFIAVATSK